MDDFLGRNDAQVRCRGLLHIVKEGDTLYKISRQHGVPLSRIMYANPYVDVYNLQAGDEICVPVVTPRPLNDGMKNPMGREMPEKMRDSMGREMSETVQSPMSGEMHMPAQETYDAAARPWKEEAGMSEMPERMQEGRTAEMPERMRESEDSRSGGAQEMESEQQMDADMPKTMHNTAALPWKDTKVSEEMVNAYFGQTHSLRT